MNPISKGYMNHRVKVIIDRIARLNNVSSEDVRTSMEDAIRKGMNSEDLKVKEVWKEIPSKNEIPTLEELILWAANRASTI